MTCFFVRFKQRADCDQQISGLSKIVDSTMHAIEHTTNKNEKKWRKHKSIHFVSGMAWHGLNDIFDTRNYQLYWITSKQACDKRSNWIDLFIDLSFFHSRFDSNLMANLQFSNCFNLRCLSWLGQSKTIEN